MVALRMDALRTGAVAESSPNVTESTIRDPHIGECIRNPQVLATAEGPSIPHCHVILVYDEIPVGLKDKLA